MKLKLICVGLISLWFSFCLAMPVTSISTLSLKRQQAMIDVTWHPGCPVAMEQLRLLTVPYWGQDQHYHHGQMIVHQRVAKSMAAILTELAKKQFVIGQMKPMLAYHGNDSLAMSANNTSAFNCRKITGQSSKFSLHSYGTAVDINPVWNPYVRGDTILPNQGRAYSDRNHRRSGMIFDHDATYTLFEKNGWRWGGDWHDLKDYQHFEKH